MQYLNYYRYPLVALSLCMAAVSVFFADLTVAQEAGYPTVAPPSPEFLVSFCDRQTEGTGYCTPDNNNAECGKREWCSVSGVIWRVGLNG